jgi:hypothetical protein
MALSSEIYAIENVKYHNWAMLFDGNDGNSTTTILRVTPLSISRRTRRRFPVFGNGASIYLTKEKAMYTSFRNPFVQGYLSRSGWCRDWDEHAHRYVPSVYSQLMSDDRLDEILKGTKDPIQTEVFFEPDFHRTRKLSYEAQNLQL